MKTVHWTWSSRQTTDAKGEVNLGKVNAVNNFCIALPSNEPRCTSCHAGYGWKDASFDFGKAENIDCLVCHDTTGKYKKFPTAAGHPTYEPREFPPKSGTMWQPPDLEAIAKAVGMPGRNNCGACHFFGGGGDHVKHGDLDSSMAKPPRTMDVHMAVDGANMSCTDCHRTKGPRDSRQGPGSVHERRRYDARLHRLPCGVSAQREQDAGQPHRQGCLPGLSHPDIRPRAADHDLLGLVNGGKGPGRRRWTNTASRPTTSRRASFVWGKDVVPSYAWFNGSVQRVLMGEKIDAAKVVHLNEPNGKRGDPASKLTPFKIMKGKQPFDAGTNVIAVPHLFGKGGYWDVFDWTVAVRDGMKTAGLPYAGPVGWVETDMYWKVNHMVVPKAKALRCLRLPRPE